MDKKVIPDQAPPLDLTVPEVARRLPRNSKGGLIKNDTISSWIVKGFLLRDGTVLRLRAKRIPGRWIIPVAALDEFMEALAQDMRGEPTSGVERSPDEVEPPLGRRGRPKGTTKAALVERARAARELASTHQ